MAVQANNISSWKKGINYTVIAVKIALYLNEKTIVVLDVILMNCYF